MLFKSMVNEIGNEHQNEMNEYFENKYLPFFVYFKHYVFESPFKVKLFFDLTTTKSEIISSFRVGYSLINKSKSIDSVLMRMCEKVAIIDSVENKQILLDVELTKYIISESLNLVDYNMSNTVSRMAKIKKEILEDSYKMYRLNNFSFKCFDDGHIIRKGDTFNEFVVDFNISRNELTIVRNKHIVLTGTTYNYASEFVKNSSKIFKVKLNRDSLKRYYDYHSNTGMYLASSVVSLCSNDFNTIYSLFEGEMDKAHLLNHELIKMAEKLFLNQKLNFKEVFVEFPNSIKSKNQEKDIVVEQIEYALSLNPSEEIRQNLEELKNKHLIEKEAKIKRKEQEKIDDEAERILITLKNYYIRGESDEERINR